MKIELDGCIESTWKAQKKNMNKQNLNLMICRRPKKALIG